MNRRSRAGQARNEYTGEMSVEEICYRSAVRAEDTLIIQQAFDGVLALLLAIDVIEEQFGLTLTGRTIDSSNLYMDHLTADLTCLHTRM